MVECPLHGWVYDIRDGKCLSTENRFTYTYDVRINGDILEIKLPDLHPAE
jgi:nitrite reductase/ring-hydroxylating ferredoxin subunit